MLFLIKIEDVRMVYQFKIELIAFIKVHLPSFKNINGTQTQDLS
jgi:hypothetical protein